MIEELKDIKINIEHINRPKFQTKFSKNYKLTDLFAIYNDGKIWKAVPIDILLRTVIIYDKYFENDQVFDMTITLCPYSLSAVCYIGKYKFVDKIYKNNIVLSKINNDDHIMSQFLGRMYSINGKKYIDKIVRRLEIKILPFRLCLSKYPDCYFLQNRIKEKYVLPKTYYQNSKLIYSKDYDHKFHPKTLVYVINYKSKTNFENKFTVLVPKNASKNKITGNHFRNDGFEKYISKMINRIRDKGGIILPIFWFAADQLLSKKKTILLA